MKQVHGTFKSFQELGAAFGVKTPKAKVEKPRKCPNCGGELRQVGGTNVYACDFSKMEDKTLDDGTTIQVFTECGNIVIDPS